MNSCYAWWSNANSKCMAVTNSVWTFTFHVNKKEHHVTMRKAKLPDEKMFGGGRSHVARRWNSSALMTDSCHLKHRRRPQTHTQHTKGCVVSTVADAAYLFVYSNMLHNTLFINPDFPGAFMCVCLCICEFLCAMLRRQPVCVCLCVSVPLRKGPHAHSKLLRWASVLSPTQLVISWSKLTCCPQRKLAHLTESHKAARKCIFLSHLASPWVMVVI